ncbi:MAG: signal recognition particle protein [Spirochaetes bacterium]|nr:signal recognition particle protein [Spirochaetota bacterium]
MLETLTKNITDALSRIRGKKRLNEKQLDETVALINDALIRSDVAQDVAEAFTKAVAKRAHGKEVLEGVNADEQFIAIVHEELVRIIGEGNASLALLPDEKLSVVLLCGLQGSGKTTSAAKIGNYFKKTRRVMLVGLDVYRPAAMEQLETLAAQAGIRCHVEKKEDKPHKILKKALFIAKKESINLMIVDTAGRLEIDEAMMAELKRVANSVDPVEKLLVMDATAGQSVYGVAKQFADAVGITGVVLTKYDSDAKGGAALSLRYATGTPVKFVGTGEHMDDIDEFDAERVASRMLGMGDVVKLVKKAQESIDQEKADEMLKNIIENNFSYNDFLTQIESTMKMGGIQKMMSMLPGTQGIADSIGDSEEKKMAHFKAMIQSMNKKERLALFPLTNARIVRIAKGSGTTVYDVNQLIKQFNNLRNLMGSNKKMARMMGGLEKMGIDLNAMNIDALQKTGR